MSRNPFTAIFDDPDSLRLLGLGRIPRCTECPRYAALVSGHTDRLAGATSSGRLPAVPANCHFQACAPLVSRYATALRADTRSVSASVLAS